VCQSFSSCWLTPHRILQTHGPGSGTVTRREIRSVPVVDDAEIRRVLARNIRAQAKRRKMKLTLLAHFADTGKSQLFRVLSGETSPSLSWIVKVATALDVEPWSLLVPPSR
jgi:hypothetical protein